MEKPTSELIHTRAEANELEKQELASLSFFEQKGFENLNRFNYSGSNFYFTGEKEGKKCFIKKFNRPDIETNKKRTKNEILCYEHLPADIRVDYIEGDIKKQYIAIEYAELEVLTKDEDGLNQIMHLALNQFPQIDASFLQATDWQSYENIFKRIEELKKLGIIKDPENIKKQFIDNKEIIENAKKIFCHVAFSFSNVRKFKNKIVMIDFEQATQDNAMVDMAKIYIEIYDDKELLERFKKILEGSDSYNENLLRLMILRRCITYIHSCYEQKNSFLDKNIKILEDLLSKQNIF